MALDTLLGRDAELARLSAAWDAVLAGGGPRTAVLLAESGLGKTRLAQAFYERLVAIAGDGGYWPADLGQDGQNLLVHPREGEHDPTHALPFLWWGVRLTDPLGHNHLSGGVLPSSVERDLVPHLEEAHREARRRERRSRALKAGAGLIADVATELVPFSSLLKSVATVGLELKGILDEGRREAARDPAAAARQRSLTFVDRLVADLGAVLGPAAGRRVPGVILLDDAQFSPYDAGVVAFVERLVATSREEAWPLLLLVTHWEREWAQPDDASVAEVLQRHGGADVLRLRPVADLGPWLLRELPGLTDEQVAAVLGRAGGNPGFLAEMVRYASSVRGRALFEGKDARRSFTDRGLQELLARSSELVELIAERLASSPDAVQQAVVLASVQGGEFLHGLVPMLAATLGASDDAVAEALGSAESPHAFVARLGEASGTFAQRVYLEVAQRHLDAWFDRDAAEGALADVLREAITSGRADEFDDDDRARFAVMVARTFEEHEGRLERRMVVAALAILLRRALRRLDVHALRALRPPFGRALELIPDEDLDGELEWLWLALDTGGLLGDADASVPVLERLVRITQETFDDTVSGWAGHMLASARVEFGDHLLAHGDWRGALDQYTRANAVFASLSEAGELEWDEPTLMAFRTATDRIGSLAYEAGSMDAARERFETVLSLTSQLEAIDAEAHRPLRSRPLRRLAAIARARDEGQRAGTLLDEALAIMRATLADDADTSEYADALAERAIIHQDADELEAALALLDEALPVRVRLLAGADTPEHRHHLALVRAHRARVLALVGRGDEGAIDIAAALADLRTLADARGMRRAAENMVPVLERALHVAVARGDDAAAREVAVEMVQRAAALRRDPPTATDRRRLDTAVRLALPFASPEQASAWLALLEGGAEEAGVVADAAAG
jgi:tetratricopeptide (TPR) repeat protein